MSEANTKRGFHPTALDTYDTSEARLKTLLNGFHDVGGTLIFAPPALGKEEAEMDAAEVAEVSDFLVHVYAHDALYPVCPTGLHHSQVLYLVLRGIKRALGEHHHKTHADGGEGAVFAPHGALHGTCVEAIQIYLLSMFLSGDSVRTYTSTLHLSTNIHITSL